MWFLFVRSGLPLELTLPRVVTFPQLLRARPSGTHPYRANPDGFVSSALQTSAALFFRFEFPHHHGTLWTFTSVHISRRSYQRSPCHPKAAGASWILGKGEADYRRSDSDEPDELPESIINFSSVPTASAVSGHLVPASALWVKGALSKEAATSG